MNQINLTEIELKQGIHKTREEGMCAMELVAYLNDEPHSDKPQCACPAITEFVIGLNDRWSGSDRQLLKPYLPRIIGTNDGLEVNRAKILAMAVCTEVLPIIFDEIGLKDHAEKLRNCKDLNEARSAADTAADAAAYAAYTAAYAAYTAAYAAADTAARAAARAAYAAAIVSAYVETDEVIVNKTLEILERVIVYKGGGL